MPEAEPSSLNANLLFIVGCGRSGTTLLFNLTQPTVSPDAVSVKLDEPREFYLSFWSPSFDIWSSRSKEREGRLVPESGEQSAPSFDRMLQALHDHKKEGETNASQTLNYLEKMPEHVLRVPQLLDLYKGEGRSIKFIYVERDWLPVALSIHRLTAEGARQSRWFGFQAAKWNAMKAYAAECVEQSTDAADRAFYESVHSAITIDQSTTAFYKGVLEWLLAKKAYSKAVSNAPMIKVKYSEVLKDV